ncbi:MAG: MOSC domain-containing protein [Gammaproteobacteria bacterium]|nr:MAG: MOSC domain-containing protein [Gammaproteobacteria bacterium]
MKTIGSIKNLYRYPVKSMRGEQLASAFVAYSGIYGDRVYAFQNPQAPAFFPYFTGRDKQQMLLYTPRFRDPETLLQPKAWTEAQSISIGITPVFASAQELGVDVETPQGDVYAIDDPRLAALLGKDSDTAAELSLMSSSRALTDGRPISLISNQTVKQLSEEIDTPVDERCFRANIYIDLEDARGFAEDELVGRTLKLGERVEIALVERDPRCMMITIDPDTGETDPTLLKQVTKAHNRQAGVYAAVLVEGVIKPGDPVLLID